MLTEKQITEIREHLERAQNPIFFFDNDPDGLCSFLLLRRYIGRGKGVAIKGAPELTVDYFKRVEELEADYIFVLDKALGTSEFFEKARERNIPVVWIDHHEVDMNIPEFVDYYNPSRKQAINVPPIASLNPTPDLARFCCEALSRNRSLPPESTKLKGSAFNKGEENFPTSYLCYQVSQKKDDLWIAVVGCIADAYIPDFYPEFKEKYPDLAVEEGRPLEIYYGGSKLGEIARMLNFGLKDRTTNVVNMLKFLTKVQSPYEIFEENSKTYAMQKRFEELNKRYKKLLEKASEEDFVEGILFFKYGGDLSISADLANGLRHKFPDKLIIVGYVSGAKINISGRGKSVRDIVVEIVGGLENATGGGHEKAVGAKIKTEDWDKFKERFLELVRKRKI